MLDNNKVKQYSAPCLVCRLQTLIQKLVEKKRSMITTKRKLEEFDVCEVKECSYCVTDLNPVNKTIFSLGTFTIVLLSKNLY